MYVQRDIIARRDCDGIKRVRKVTGAGSWVAEIALSIRASFRGAGMDLVFQILKGRGWTRRMWSSADNCLSRLPLAVCLEDWTTRSANVDGIRERNKNFQFSTCSLSRARFFDLDSSRVNPKDSLLTVIYVQSHEKVRIGKRSIPTSRGAPRSETKSWILGIQAILTLCAVYRFTGFYYIHVIYLL